MIPTIPEDEDLDIIICVTDFGDLTGVIYPKPELKAECWQDQPVDVDRAWQEVERSCGGRL